MTVTKVAIPVFGSRVSPRCDCAPEILIIEMANGEIKNRESVSITGMNELQVMKALMFRGVNTIIGGAMPGFCHRMAEAMGMKVIQVSGAPVEDIIETLKTGGMPEPFSRGRHKHGRRAGRGCPWQTVKKPEK